ncbi:hypothetical protein [Xenorhabdus sp. KK7.4]|uniref:hypothetical protein n=1 Tax=Xenorhabdus sp. KK7.4 TaxID=1851572 RepID=UPI000C0565E0|nr:hypothetical protein [Xenorhabdus sp. KK7.4]PHM52492.1 hypothetical protein Xekk_03169 [Xenorhabdus sp. KK7.4]
MKKLIVMLVLGMVSFGAMAVDGYKDAKFGIAEKEFLSKKLCNFEKVGNFPQMKEVTFYLCTDFLFADKKHGATALFLNGKFKRLDIIMDSRVLPLKGSLERKYGTPSSMPSQEEIDNVKRNGGNVFMGFDGDTVRIELNVERGKEYTALVYTDPDFGKVVQELTRRKLEKDI